METGMAEDGRQDATALATGYAKSHRIYEMAGIGVTTATFLWLVARLLSSPTISGWWFPLAALVGILFADFVSGLFHWAFDTWGSVDTPVVGQLAIRTFRHHHVDEKAITTHDFVETNGHNFALALLPAAVGVFRVVPDRATLLDVFIGMACAAATLFVSLTSQIHKWSHQDEPSRVIQLLQRARLVLSPEHHALHHAAPHTRNYCITVGWLNGPLRAIRFFETFERVITAITGAVPREDDLGANAALEVLAADEPAPASLVTRD
jgi:ubiquitin-conjugating enzyme E2 variant